MARDVRLSPSLLLTLLWIVSLPILLLAGRFLPSVPIVTPERVLFALAAAPLLLRVLRQPGSLQRPGPVEKAMAVYLAVIVVSWCTNVPGKPAVTLKQDADFLLTCFVMPFTAFLIARNTDWSHETVTVCLWALVVGVGVYLLLFGAVQYVHDWQFLVPDAVKQHPDRAKGPFDNSVPYGVVVSMLLVITLLAYLRARGRLQRVALVAIAIGLVQSVVASKVRAAWVAVPLALFLPAVRFPRIRFLAVLLALDLVAQVLLAPAIDVGSRAIGRVSGPPETSPPHVEYWGLEERLVEPDPLYNRVAVVKISRKMIAHRPVFGLGFGLSTFNARKADYYASAGVDAKFADYPVSPHNDFLNVLVMMGAVGGLCYLAVLWTSAQVLWRQAFRGTTLPGREIATFVGSLFVIVIVAGQFHSVMHMSYVQVLFFFMLGIAARGGDAIAAGRLHPKTA